MAGSVATKDPKWAPKRYPPHGGGRGAAYMMRMVFSHLVDPPRLVSGGVLFTMDTHDLQRTVCVTDAALALFAPAAEEARHRLRYVMENIEALTIIAKRKAISRVPELVVIDASDAQSSGGPIRADAVD
ncbi:hypothetical protein Q4F19_13270 [Sphingomonas sp. BIUV-7]|uniref:Uncharacterized protein n=1 Tax=Sphingomonas natans TaxID=3063330 RepID=A0ABT8YAJ0_9SPHN|nr:hypothetical protein [Sphingomonas sp. BIUV-7]MDO6415358.1 hypothetical protein [Sphingomonas sp. BIUV-7]